MKEIGKVSVGEWVNVNRICKSFVENGYIVQIEPNGFTGEYKIIIYKGYEDLEPF